MNTNDDDAGTTGCSTTRSTLDAIAIHHDQDNNVLQEQQDPYVLPSVLQVRDENGHVPRETAKKHTKVGSRKRRKPKPGGPMIVRWRLNDTHKPAEQNRHVAVHNRQPSLSDPYSNLVSVYDATTGLSANEIYEAGWWLRYSPGSNAANTSGSEVELSRFVKQYMLDFWENTRCDSMLVHTLCSFAASKRAFVTGLSQKDAYLSHKGKSLALIGQALRSRGRQVDNSVIAAIGFQVMLALAEGAYDEAFSHVVAIQRLASDRLLDLSSWQWRHVVWGDVRHAVQFNHKPMLPFAIPADHRFPAPFKQERLAEVRALAIDNVSEMPLSDSLTRKKAIRMVMNLYEASSSKDLFTLTPEQMLGRVYYTNYFITWLLPTQEEATTYSQTFNASYCLLTGAHIAHWSFGSSFGSWIAPQSELQIALQLRLYKQLLMLQDLDICVLWTRSASLKSLLWILYHAAAISSKFPPRTQSWMPLPVPAYFLQHLKSVVRALDISTLAQFQAEIYRYPSTNTWSPETPDNVWAQMGIGLGTRTIAMRSAVSQNQEIGVDQDDQARRRGPDPNEVPSTFQTALLDDC